MKLRCRLLDRRDNERTGEVVGFAGSWSAPHFTVAFGPGEEVVLPLGSDLDLALFGPELYKPCVFHCRAVRRTSAEGHEAYTFAVDPGQRCEFEVAIGGRSSVRVQPAPEAPVLVSLSHPAAAGSVVCPLIDASVTGLSAQVAWSDERHLVRARQVRARLSLPGLDEDATGIGGTIRRRAIDGDHIVYGIAFDPEESSEVNPTLAVLTEWIEARYLEVAGAMRVMRRTG